jgi:TP901 family phage tail tape measure protein
MSSDLSILIRAKLNAEVTVDDIKKDLLEVEKQLQKSPIYVDVFVRDGSIKRLEELKVKLAELATFQAKALNEALNKEMDAQQQRSKNSKSRQKDITDETKKIKEQIAEFKSAYAEEIAQIEEFGKKINSVTVAQAGKPKVKRENYFNQYDKNFYQVTRNDKGDIVGLKKIEDEKKALVLEQQMAQQAMSLRDRVLAKEAENDAKKSVLSIKRLEDKKTELELFHRMNAAEIADLEATGIKVRSITAKMTGKPSRTIDTVVKGDSIYSVTRNSNNQVISMRAVQDAQKAQKLLEDYRRASLTEEERALEDTQKLQEKQDKADTEAQRRLDRRQRMIEARKKLAEQERAVREAERDALRIKNIGDTTGVSVNSMSDKDIEAAVKAKYGDKMVGNFDTNSIQKTFYQSGQEIARFSAYVKDADGQIRRLSLGVASNDKQLRQHHSSLINTGNILKSVTAQIGNMFRGLLVGFGATKVFFMLANAVRDGIREIFNIDKAMTNLRKVTDETTQAYQSFYFEANKIGDSLGKTTAEVVQATADFARLGYTLTQAKNLSKEAVLYSNVGDVTVQDSSKVLISTMKGFGVEIDAQAQNVRRVVDMFNEVGNNYAISSAGIGEALQRSAATLHQAGNSIEQSIGMITAANAVVQDPEQVGTALKTIAARLRGVSEDGEKLTEGIPELEKAFKSVGVELKKDDVTFRSTYDILNDLADAWGTMTDIQKANISELVSGKRQANIFSAMIENIKDMRNATATATNSIGSATKEQEKYMQSLEYKVAQAKNAWVGFWQATTDSKSFGQLLYLSTQIAKALTSVVDKFGALGPAIIAANVGLYALNSTFRDTYKTMVNFFARSAGAENIAQVFNSINNSLKSINVKNIKDAFSGAFESVKQFGSKFIESIKSIGDKKTWTQLKDNIQTAMTNFKLFITQGVNGKSVFSAFTSIAVGGLRAIGAAALTVAAELAPLLIITGITIAIQKLWEWYQKTRTAASERVKTLQEEQQQYKQNAEQITTLITEYEKLENVTNLSAEQQDRLVTVRNDLANLMPGIIKYYDEEGKAVYATAQEVKNLADQYGLANEGKDRLIADQAGEAGKGRYKNIQKQLSKRATEESLAEQAKSNMDNYNKQLSDAKANGIVLTDAQLAEITAQLRVYEQAYSEHQAKIKAIDDKILADRSWWAGAFTARNRDVLRNAQITDKNIELALDNLAQSYANANRVTARDSEEFEKNWETIANKVAKDVKDGKLNITPEMDKDAFDLAIEYFKSLGFNADDAAKAIENFKKQQAENNDVVFDFGTRVKSAVDEVDGLMSSLNDLASAYATLEKGESLSVDTINKLITAHPELMSAIENVNGVLGIQKDALEKVMQAEELKTKKSLENQKTELDGLQKQTETKLQLALQEIGMIMSVTEARKLSAQALAEEAMTGVNGPGAMHASEVISNSLKKNNVAGLLDALNGMDQIKSYLSNMGGTNFTSSAIKNSTDNGSSKKDITPFAEDKFADQLTANELAISHVRNEMEKTNQATEYYSKLTNEEIKLLKEKQDIYHSNADALRAEREQLLALAASETDLEKKNDYLQKADQAQSKIQQLQQNWWSTQGEIDKLTSADPKQLDSVTKITDELEGSLTALDQKMQESTVRMKQYTEGSKAYRDELVLQNGLIIDKIAATDKARKSLEAEAALIQGRLNNEQNMSASVRQILEERLKGIQEKVRSLNKDVIDLNGSLIDNNKAITDGQKTFENAQKELADKMVDAYKKVLDERKNALLKELDEEKDAEARRHEDVIKALEEEEKQYERVYNERMALIDAQQAQNDFNRELDTAIKDRNDTQKQIDRLSLDNSMEGQAKLAELRKKLAEQDQNIEQIKEKRKTQVRKDALKEELDTYKTGIDDKKKAEDDLNKSKDRYFEDQKKRIEAEYDAEINNTEKISLIRQKAMEGDFNWLKTQLGTYFDEFGTLADKTMGDITGKIKANIDLAEQLKELEKDIATFHTNYSSNYSSGSTTTDTTNTGTTHQMTLGEAEKENKNNAIAYWTEYNNTGNIRSDLLARNAELRKQFSSLKELTKEDLSNDLAQLKQDTLRKYIQNKIRWQQIMLDTGEVNNEQQQALAKENQRWRQLWNFPDYTYEEIIKNGLDKFDTGGYTGNFGPGGKLAMLHEKEIVLNKKDTANLFATVDVVRRIVPFLKDLGSYLSKPASPAVAGGPTVSIHIDKFVGTEDAVEALSNKIVSKLKRRGAGT